MEFELADINKSNWKNGVKSEGNQTLFELAESLS